MDDDTTVYVYSDSRYDFEPKPAYRVICPECGNGYWSCDEDGESCMWWEVVIPGEPFLQCDCGEQFYSVMR